MLANLLVNVYPPLSFIFFELILFKPQSRALSLQYKLKSSLFIFFVYQKKYVEEICCGGGGSSGLSFKSNFLSAATLGLSPTRALITAARVPHRTNK